MTKKVNHIGISSELLIEESKEFESATIKKISDQPEREEEEDDFLGVNNE